MTAIESSKCFTVLKLSINLYNFEKCSLIKKNQVETAECFMPRQKHSCIVSIACANVHVQPISCCLTLTLGMLNYCNYILTMSLYSFLFQTFTSHSKLSATVPAFVPREAYTGPTFPNNLVINSNLSPLVPEFKPSVSVTSYALPYKPGHHFQYPYHQSYIKQGKFNIKLQQVSQ